MARYYQPQEDPRFNPESTTSDPRFRPESGGGSVPISPNQAEGSVAAMLGYGHTEATGVRAYRTVAELIRYFAMQGTLPVFASDRTAVAWIVDQFGTENAYSLAQQYLRNNRIRIFERWSGQPGDPAVLGGGVTIPGLGASGQGSSYGVGELFMAPFRSMSDSDFERLQRNLFDAGFYDPEAGTPTFGDKSDPFFRTAWQGAINEYLATGDQKMSIESFLAQRAVTGGPISQGILLPTEQLNLTSPAQLRQQADRVAQDVLGRGLDKDEKATMVELIHRLETQQQMQTIGINTANTLAEGGLNLGTVAGSIGPDQVAQIAASLEAQYGLGNNGQWRSLADNIAKYGPPGSPGYVDSDHLRGMAVDLSGSQEQMDALAAWARQNEGPGKLFETVLWQVPDHYDHVHLSFNSYVGEGAEIGTALTDPGSTSDSDIDSFMAAMRKVESTNNYDWVDNGYGAHGAYQFLTDTWNYAASLAGVNPSDHSPQAQDAAARALMRSYYNKYGDWRLVAAAWHGGEGLADNAVEHGLDYLKSVGDANIDTYSYVQRVMDAMGQGPMGGLPAPNVQVQTGIDAEAELIEHLRKKYPAESKAHDIAGVFDRAAGMLFGGGGGGMF